MRRGMKKVTTVSRDKVKSFDFKKKPHKPGFLFPVAREIISKPVLNGRNFKLTKNNMEGIDGPYLMLVTHSSMIDFMVMTVAVQPYRANNVMTLEGFNTYTEPLMRSLGVLGTRKYISDLNLIKNIRYCIETLKNPFVLHCTKNSFKSIFAFFKYFIQKRPPGNFVRRSLILNFICDLRLFDVSQLSVSYHCGYYRYH